MELRVAVPDAASAKALVQRLAGVFDPAAVMLDADSPAVGVQTGREVSQTVVQVLDAVEDRLDEALVEAVTVSLDGRSHTLARPGDWPLAKERVLSSWGVSSGRQ